MTVDNWKAARPGPGAGARVVPLGQCGVVIGMRAALDALALPLNSHHRECVGVVFIERSIPES
jgi:hypothetical protein